MIQFLKVSSQKHGLKMIAFLQFFTIILVSISAHCNLQLIVVFVKSATINFGRSSLQSAGSPRHNLRISTRSSNNAADESTSQLAGENEAHSNRHILLNNHTNSGLQLGALPPTTIQSPGLPESFMALYRDQVYNNAKYKTLVHKGSGKEVVARQSGENGRIWNFQNSPLGAFGNIRAKWDTSESPPRFRYYYRTSGGHDSSSLQWSGSQPEPHGNGIRIHGFTPEEDRYYATYDDPNRARLAEIKEQRRRARESAAQQQQQQQQRQELRSGAGAESSTSTTFYDRNFGPQFSSQEAESCELPYFP